MANVSQQESPPQPPPPMVLHQLTKIVPSQAASCVIEAARV